VGESPEDGITRVNLGTEQEPIWLTPLNLIGRCHRLKAQRDALLEAAKDAKAGFDDWMLDYAADQCDAIKVRDAQARIHKDGGVAYISKRICALKAAIAAAETEGQ